LITFSIELLPAPLGPMMARTSCWRTLKLMSVQRLDAAEAQADVLRSRIDVADVHFLPLIRLLS
jgi:hypothetical protein